MKRLVVLLPTYNEKNNIEKTINDVFSQGKDLTGWEIIILVADDTRSKDGTEEKVRELMKSDKRIHFMKVEPGLGVGVIKGNQYAIEHLNPTLLATLDADGQVEADVLTRMVKGFEDGFDLLIGSRFVQGGQNRLPPSRRLFTAGASFFCRLVMGPFSVKEFTNSARAFTPQLFNKINLKRLPWREQTFIIMPAFLNEAIQSGAKYKEVPLVFKNRAEGYSKNKTINYTYDVITYALDARLHKLGINIPLFHMTRRAKTLIKFGVVGFVGTMVDFIFYNLFITYFGLPPASSKGFSTEMAILNNFTFNNLWTFRHRKTKTKLWQKFLQFNFFSLGGLLIAAVVVKVLHEMYGDGRLYLGPISIAYYNLYFFATIPPVMTWNFLINHFVTWKHQKD